MTSGDPIQSNFSIIQTQVLCLALVLLRPNLAYLVLGSDPTAHNRTAQGSDPCWPQSLSDALTPLDTGLIYGALTPLDISSLYGVQSPLALIALRVEIVVSILPYSHAHTLQM